jgi:hypothetical protein
LALYTLVTISVTSRQHVDEILPKYERESRILEGKFMILGEEDVLPMLGRQFWLLLWIEGIGKDNFPKFGLNHPPLLGSTPSWGLPFCLVTSCDLEADS